MSLFRNFLLFLVASVVLASSGMSAVSAYAPVGGLTYNDPYGTHGQQYKNAKIINDAIRNAPKGSTIRIAQYSADIQSYLDAVVKAKNRGVNIRIVTSAHSTKSNYWPTFRRALGSDISKPSYIVACSGGCFTSREKSSQHAKFYTFSQTGTAKQVVMVSSGNQTSTQAEKGMNSLYTMNGNATMYSAFWRYIEDMARYAGIDNSSKPVDYYRVRGSGPFTAILMPSVERREHPYRSILGKVACKAKGSYGKNGRTTIRVGMSLWNNDHAGIAEQLVALSKRGCYVEVIVTGHATSVDVQRTLIRGKNARLEVRDSSRDLNGDGKIDKYLHDKTIAISGSFGGKQTKAVWMGSFNLSTSAFRSNNDVLLKLEGARAWQQFTDNFKAFKQHSPLLNKVSANAPGASNADADRSMRLSDADLTPESAFPEE